jgi:hypothetical protein
MTDLEKTEEKKQELTPIQAKWQEAQYLAQSSLLPKHFHGQPANVLIALEYAKQLSTANRQLSPISVMQNLYVVHGNCGLSSKFMIALANSSGKLDHPIRFETDYKDGKVFAVKAVTAINGQEISYVVNIETAKAEGWDKNPKYKSLPQLMLSYRAGTFLIRLNCPEVVMGLQAEEDVIDIEASEGRPIIKREETPLLGEGLNDEDLL